METANLASGAFIKPATESSVNGSGATGAQVQQALDEQGLSFNGSGITVGVLSDSFDNAGGAAADEASGALPPADNINVIKDLSSGGTDEGRAMMQIIHDIAPGANLAFYTAFDSEQDFANGILALAAAGCKVIVDDVSYFDEPFFQNGPVAQAIQTVEAEGVTYVTAAGNDASNGYQAVWSPVSGTFDGHRLTDAENFGGSTPLVQTITVNTENTAYSVPLLLEWNQAYGTVSSSTADLEILVFNSKGALVGTATNASNNEPTNPWVEYDFTETGTYYVAIENLHTGTDPEFIKEILEGNGLPATISNSNTGTVFGHAMTPGVISTGAVSVAETPALGVSPPVSESFSSSDVGTELLFANDGTPLSKPDQLSPILVSGVDGIQTTVSKLPDFFGTSAAAASLAGVAALVLSANPELSPTQVAEILEGTAVPMTNSVVSGAGLVQVDPAINEALATEGDAPCYCLGTLIATVRGEIAVQELVIGDEVVTAAGKPRPIKWIGRRSYSGRLARGSHVMPICIKAGALDIDRPRRDLWISPHHAMFLDGVLIEAIDLVNGVSIIQAERVERVDYFHIELDTHDVIVAEGAFSESFVDDDSRGIFQNAHEFKALYPDGAIVRAACYCAPRLGRGMQVEAARRRIARRAGIVQARPPPARGPRALVIDSRLPQVGHDGGANAILDHMRALQDSGFEVSFLALERQGGHGFALSSLGVSVLSMPQSGLFGDFARAHTGRFDLIYLHRVETATRCLQLARRYFDAQIVYSVADLHHLRLKGESAFDSNHAPELMQQARDVALQEFSAAISADWVITHSVSEAEQLEQVATIAATHKVRVIPWAVTCAPIHKPFAERSGVAFIGSFEHAPDVDAARWLVENIMPLVRREAPKIRCSIIGGGVSNQLRHELTRPGIDVLGRVDDLAVALEQLRLTVAPLRFGAGLKDKVLRSLASGLPCIGTSEAFNGMPELPAAITNLCQGETAFDLAAAIVRMHRDEQANGLCADAGLRYIADGYNLSRVNNLIREIAQPALDGHQAKARARSDYMVLDFGERVQPAVGSGSAHRVRPVIFR
jgi:glycosyltransferase involved in cell wall biosynthesis